MTWDPQAHPRDRYGRFVGQTGGGWVQQFAQAVREQHPGVALDLSGGGDRPVVLSRIVVPKAERGHGIGSQILQSLAALADAHGQWLALTPSSDFGGSKSRLTKFYRGFGFTPNTGRSRDLTISETMIRPPAADWAQTLSDRL